MRRLTPLQAIRQECRYCLNNAKLAGQVGCASRDCHLSDTVLPPVKRIKAHCLTCIPEQSIYGVKACDGKVLNPEPHICPLHFYRLGKNPNRKGGIPPEGKKFNGDRGHLAGLEGDKKSDRTLCTQNSPDSTFMSKKREVR